MGNDSGCGVIRALATTAKAVRTGGRPHASSGPFVCHDRADRCNPHRSHAQLSH